MRKLFLLLPMIIVCLAATAADAQEKAEPSLPDYVMKQVVERIVIDHFDDPQRSGVVYFSAKNIKREWLPKIANIEFVFVPKADGREVHFFKAPERVGEIYTIDFGSGDPDCSASGMTWQFQVIRGKLTNFEFGNSGWGMGCGCGSSQ